MIYRIKPATRPASTVAFELSFANSAASWTITYAGDCWQESQRYGLEQASREILQDLAKSGEAISPVGHVLISQFGKTA